MTITAEQYNATLEGTNDVVEIPTPTADTPPPATNDLETPPEGDTPPADVNTPPPATPTTPATPPATTPFNIEEELVRITNGAVKTKEELSAILERAKSIPEFETRVKTYEQENADLKAKAEANPFANDYIKKLNDLTKSGANESQIQAFSLLNRTDLDALSPMDASSLALQIKHGLTPDEAKTYLNEKYGIDPENPEAQLSKSAEIALKVDSTTDRDFLRTHKAEVSQVPEDKTAQMQALQEQANHQRIQTVTPIAQTVFNDVVTNTFKEISINGLDGDKAVKIPLPISEESKTSLWDAANNYVTNFNIQPDEDGKAKIAAFVKNAAWVQNGEKWVIEAANQRELMVRAEYNNPTGKIPRGDDNPALGATSKEKREQAIADAVLNY